MTPPLTSEELACPFCGKPAGRMGEWAFCPDDMCPAGGRYHRLAAWNRRAVDEAGVERVMGILEGNAIKMGVPLDDRITRIEAVKLVRAYLGLGKERGA